MPNQTVIFCANCFENSHDMAVAVNEVNTQGGCSKCGSMSVMSANVVRQQLSGNDTDKIKTQTARDKMLSMKPTDWWRHRNENAIHWLTLGGHQDVAAQWDGWLFDAQFSADGNVEFVFRNCDGSKEIIAVDIVSSVRVTK